jgi:hypothetical protein
MSDIDPWKSVRNDLTHMEELLTRHAQRFFCVSQHGYSSLHFIITFLYMPKKATTELEVLETSTTPISDDSTATDDQAV